MPRRTSANTPKGAARRRGAPARRGRCRIGRRSQARAVRVGALEISFERTPSKPDLAACFDILEENMKEQYEVNPWGWDPKMKRAELADDEARFVLVRDDDRVVAFAHFRFEVDDDDAPERAVLYVRELQVAEVRRGSGIGRRVMGLLQLVGAKLELDCLLTVSSPSGHWHSRGS